MTHLFLNSRWSTNWCANVIWFCAAWFRLLVCNTRKTPRNVVTIRYPMYQLLLVIVPAPGTWYQVPWYQYHSFITVGMIYRSAQCTSYMIPGAMYQVNLPVPGTPNRYPGTGTRSTGTRYQKGPVAHVQCAPFQFRRTPNGSSHACQPRWTGFSFQTLLPVSNFLKC